MHIAILAPAPANMTQKKSTEPACIPGRACFATMILNAKKTLITAPFAMWLRANASAMWATVWAIIIVCAQKEVQRWEKVVILIKIASQNFAIQLKDAAVALEVLRIFARMEQVQQFSIRRWHFIMFSVFRRLSLYPILSNKNINF